MPRISPQVLAHLLKEPLRRQRHRVQRLTVELAAAVQARKRRGDALDGAGREGRVGRAEASHRGPRGADQAGEPGQLAEEPVPSAAERVSEVVAGHS